MIKLFSTWDWIQLILVSVILLGILGSSAIVILSPLFTQDDVIITIQEKDRVVDKSGDGAKYLVWTEEGEVFKNTDYLLFGKFNSADLQGQLHEGKTYSCHVAGWRVPLFSWYRNIIKCEEK